MIDFENLAVAMGELDEDTVKEILEAIDNTADAEKAMDACQKGMDTVGKLFEEGEYFVGDLIFAGDIMNGALEIIRPVLSADSGAGGGKVLLCTVRDDLHDIGKSIVKSLLEAGGFEVRDLGVDVSPETVVETAKKAVSLK